MDPRRDLGVEGWGWFRVQGFQWPLLIGYHFVCSNLKGIKPTGPKRRALRNPKPEPRNPKPKTIQVKNRGEKSDHFDFLEWEKGREAVNLRSVWGLGFMAQGVFRFGSGLNFNLGLKIFGFRIEV